MPTIEVLDNPKSNKRKSHKGPQLKQIKKGSAKFCKIATSVAQNLASNNPNALFAKNCFLWLSIAICHLCLGSIA